MPDIYTETMKRPGRERDFDKRTKRQDRDKVNHHKDNGKRSFLTDSIASTDDNDGYGE